MREGEKHYVGSLGERIIRITFEREKREFHAILEDRIFSKTNLTNEDVNFLASISGESVEGLIKSWAMLEWGNSKKQYDFSPVIIEVGEEESTVVVDNTSFAPINPEILRYFDFWRLTLKDVVKIFLDQNFIFDPKRIDEFEITTVGKLIRPRSECDSLAEIYEYDYFHEIYVNHLLYYFMDLGFDVYKIDFFCYRITPPKGVVYSVDRK